jgi:hypothetical protein
MRGIFTLPGTRWIVLSLILLHAWGCLPATYDNMSKMRFSTVGKIPVVQGRINGKRAFFIIDTGASCSILNESGSLHFGFGTYALVNHRLTGLGGNTNINQAVNCVVEFGPLRIAHRTFRTRQLDHITDLIKQNENIEIAGILGSDIFNRYGITIDFKHNLICFNQ